jgi:NADH-quinone oxidoreductase subunit L
MLRLWKIVFLGAPRGDGAGHAHEGGLSLTGPLVVLAALSLVGGYRGLYPRGFEGILSLVPEAEGSEHVIILLTSLVVLTVGAVTALRFYGTDGSDALQVKKPELFGLLSRLRTSFDRAYGYYVEKIQQRAAILLNFFDVIVLAGGIVRGLVAGTAEIVGFGARALHTGKLSNYVYWFLGGVVVLWAFAAGIL